MKINSKTCSKKELLEYLLTGYTAYHIYYSGLNLSRFLKGEGWQGRSHYYYSSVENPGVKSVIEEGQSFDYNSDIRWVTSPPLLEVKEWVIDRTGYEVCVLPSTIISEQVVKNVGKVYVEKPAYKVAVRKIYKPETFTTEYLTYSDQSKEKMNSLLKPWEELLEIPMEPEENYGKALNYGICWVISEFWGQGLEEIDT